MVLYGLLTFFTGVCKETVRLVNGESERSGIVEICQNGVWTPVCSDQWDTPDATVVCRQLGYFYNGEIINMHQY